MAQVSKNYLLRTITNRHFASAAAKCAGSTEASEVNVSTLPNNTIVASQGSSLPLSRLSVVIKAGSRYDPADAPGLNHVLRASAGLTTSQSTRFGIIRNIQQLGASLSCTSTRDTIAYTLEATCDNFQNGLKFLKDVVVNQAFKPWELDENGDRIKYELSTVPPEARLVDLLHRTAYRSGLGNALFVEDFNISRIDTETLQHFVGSTFTGSRTAVVGVGVDHSTVSSFAADLELNSSSGPNDTATYVGGNSAVLAPGGLAYVGVVAESAGLSSGREALAFAVLKYALGGWSSIKWSPGNSPLAKAVEQFAKPTTVSAFNAAHSDSGLFGLLIATNPDDVQEVTKAAIKGLLSTSLSGKVIQGAKNQLIRDLSEQTGEQRAWEIGNQLLHIDNPPKSVAELIGNVNEIGSSDVDEALSKFAKGAKTVASYGNVGAPPHTSDFK